jgi:hypothetical protein
MLKFNVHRFFRAKGVDQPYAYMKENGFTASFATRLNTGKLRMMNLKDVETLCVFFQRTPNDLLEWTPGKEVTDTSTHPLRDLIRIDSGVNIKAILNAIPVTKLAEVEKMLKELQAK